jgi:iron complex outermembrane receptor protein
MFDNKIEGATSGVEAWGSYRFTNTWRVHAGVVQQRVRLHLKPGSADLGGVAALGNDAQNWWTARSTWDITPRHEFDVKLRHVGALPNPAVPAYTAVDVRLGWKLRQDLHVSLLAQNLFDPRHAEWGTLAARPEFERGVFLKVLWRL